MKKKSIAYAISLVFASGPAHSLDRDGDHIGAHNVTMTLGSPAWLAEMQRRGLVALYTFNNTTGPVRDVSGYRNSGGNLEPLDLIIDDPDANDIGPKKTEVVRTGNSLRFDYASLVHSNGPASKIIRECKASGELTVEMWLKNTGDARLNLEEPVRRIFTLSNPVTPPNPNVPVAQQLSSNNRNFFLSFFYDEGQKYKFVNRTSDNRDGAEINSDLSIASNDLHHLVFTKDSSGVSRLYTSYYDSSDVSKTNPITVLRREYTSSSIMGLGGNFSNWDDNAVLGIGNEISYADPRAEEVQVGQDEPESQLTSTEDKRWLGEIYMLAVYCKAQSAQDVLGDKAPGQPVYESFAVDPNMSVSTDLQKAALLYKRLGGVSTSLANPLLTDMAVDIAAGNHMAAAAKATESSDFLNITVRDFASRMSSREETVNVELNDFVATVIGIVRDDVNAKQMLTGDFTYEGDPNMAAVPSNKISDILTSNNHYTALESGRFDLKRVLRRVSPQVLYSGDNVTINPNTDAAGLLTSRAFMQAHATAGTNRRLVEYAFREFLCVPIDKWADSTAPDNYVGRDIDRFPAGDHNKYTTSCRSCHSVMDPLRGAFAYYDFSNGYVKHAARVQRSPANEDDDMEDTIKLWPNTNVVRKMNHNDHVFSNGHMTTSNAFANYATRGANSSYFGWSSNTNGAGVKDFGQMIADAEAFPFCMAKRAFRSVCKREPASIDKSLLEAAAQDFKASNYKLKTLFERIAISDECLGEDL